MVMGTTASAFTGYFDDSGHPDDQPAVIVAGHITTVEQWLFFEREWNEVMGTGPDGSPKIFHMTDLSETERSEKIPKLISIIKRRVRMQFSITIPVNEYLQVNSKYALEEWHGRPYALAGRTMCVMIHEWEAQYNHDRLPLKIVFENGTKHKGDLIDVMDRDDDCPFPIFESKKDVVALQAADLLAGQIFWSQKNNGHIRPDFKKLLQHQHDFNEYTKNDLIKTCKNSGTPLRSDIPPGQEFAFYSSLKKTRTRKLVYSGLEERDKVSRKRGNTKRV